MKNKPNIVFILIDDMGWRDLGVAGSSFYETPNIDALAEQGMRFTNAYAACPVCSPSRASILTGRYPARLGLTDWIDMSGKYHPCTGRLTDAPYIKYLPLNEKTVARSLRENGYETWHVGKWHLGGPDYYPEHHGFDVNIGGCHWGHPHNGYFSPYGIETLNDGPDGEYLTDRITDEAVQLIRNAGDKPFFLNLWHYAVHIPIQAAPDLTERFRKKAAETGLDKKQAIVEGEHFPTDQKKNLRIQRRVVQSDSTYAAMIYNLDEIIGRILDALEETGKGKDTIIIFTSDNGGLSTAEGSPTCNLPAAEGKGWMYDGGVRVPLIVRWPGVIHPGSVCPVPVTGTDFYPTLLEAAGLNREPENHCDGVSMMPLLKQSGVLQREALFWHYPHYGNQGGTPASAVRAGKWKLIEFFEDGRTELYYIESDIEEKHELSEKYPGICTKLKSILSQWRVSVEAKIPERNPAADIARY